MHDLDRTVLEDANQNYFEGEAESVFDEAEEMELASELLSVGDDQELEQFLGSLIKKAGHLVGKVVHSPLGHSLLGVLKSVAKKALPTIGAAVGTALGGPAGGMLGGTLANKAGQIFGLELEGLSPEDQEYEAARRFVRFAGDAARHLAHGPHHGSPRHLVQSAVARAAQRHAPGLLRPAPGHPHHHHHHHHHPGVANHPAAPQHPMVHPHPAAGHPAPSAYHPATGAYHPVHHHPGVEVFDDAGVIHDGSFQSGRWVRRGRQIILYGI